MEFLQTPIFIVIFLFLFVSLFLFTNNKGKNISNKLLGFVFLCFGLWVWDVYATLFLYDTFPHLANIFNNLLWLIGPCLLLYTYSVIFEDFTLRKKHLLHLIPCILVVIITLFVYHVKPLDYKRNYLEHAMSDRSILIWGSSSLIITHVLVYIIVSLRSIGNYQNIISNMVSNADKIRLSWLKFMLLGSFIIFFSLISFVVNQYFRWTDNLPISLIYIYVILLFIFITATLFRSLKQPEIFSGISSEEVRNIPKYAKSGLTDADSTAYTALLEEYMKSERPYLDPNLTISDLAAELNLTTRVISQVINNTLGFRFFDYINRYRVDEAVKMIQNPPDPKMTILEIMYETGFNSKSSFNTAFKKFTGKTPSEIKRHAKI